VFERKMTATMPQNYSDLPYGAGRPMVPNYRAPGKPTLKGLLLLPVLPFVWLLRGYKRRRDRGKTKLQMEILQLRRELAGLRAVNLELLKGKERAEINDQRKTEFLARVTHELRTPLNAVVGFADLVREEPYGELGSPKYVEYLTDIRATSAHMLDIVNDLLDVAKIEAGRIEMRESWSVVPVILDDCRRLMQNQAEANGINIVIETPPDLPGLYCDPGRVRQIVVNLLSNAVKFTPKRGRITLAARTDRVGGIVIRVSDTGIGIPQEALDDVFEPYIQIRGNHLVKGQQGSGLGLSLVRILADLHQASLGIESVENRGTTITVRFPPTRVRTIS
jgi:two-component system cell cycle sensor histidine kinase PleC